MMANPDIPIPSPLFMGPSGGKEKELREESGGRGGGREGGKGRGRAKGRGRGRGGGGAGRVQSDNPFDKFAEVRWPWGGADWRGSFPWAAGARWRTRMVEAF